MGSEPKGIKVRGCEGAMVFWGGGWVRNMTSKIGIYVLEA